MPEPELTTATPFAGGRYVLLREIGRGGTAIVHLARDLQHDRVCAIKILAPKFAAREELRQRFRRECEAMYQIRHPNVLRVFTWGITEGSMFLVSEYAEGGSAGSWVREHGPMGPCHATELMVQVCQGVAAAHEHNVVHRDVKPDNVLLAGDGTARVCDFGIAQVRVLDEDPLTRTGSSIGTLGFMSPEQLDDPRIVDGRADIYAIGATLWYLLRGRAPTHAFNANPYEQGIPGPLCPVVARSTAFRRDQRQADVNELRAELVAALARLPEDPPSERDERMSPPAPDPDAIPTESSTSVDDRPVRAFHEPEVTWVDD